MKSGIVLIILLLVAYTYGFSAAPDTKYDWDKHEDAEDLEISLKNEVDSIFLIYIFKNGAPDSDVQKSNDQLRNNLVDHLKDHDDVVFTQIDLTPSTEQDAEKKKKDDEKTKGYTDLVKNEFGIDPALVDQGPIVAVLNRGVGSWIQGHESKLQDSFEEAKDSIEIFIRESKDRMKGGTGKVAGSSTAKRGSLVKVNGHDYSY